MDKLLKEAIADAKAVRETALANAKLALEEAFTPKLQSMLSKKIREEEEMEEEEEVEEMPETARFRKLANISEEEDEMEDDMDMDMDMEDEGGEEDFEEEDFSDEGGEEDFEEESSEETSEEAPEEDLDLEAIIRELEGEDEEMAEEGMDYESEEEEMAEEGMDYEEEEDVDINELVKALREEDEDEEMAEEGMKRRKKKMMEADDEEESEKDKELEEAYGVIKYLRSKINEVNLLNAKLLYVNKVFRNKNLTENQKVQVIETFDRAKTVRETKLIYATIAESISKQAPAKNKGKRIVENFSSAPIKGTKRPILESNNQVARFQKLAGINKNF